MDLLKLLPQVSSALPVYVPSSQLNSIEASASSMYPPGFVCLPRLASGEEERRRRDLHVHLLQISRLVLDALGDVSGVDEIEVVGVVGPV